MSTTSSSITSSSITSSSITSSSITSSSITSSSITVEDRLELHELPGRYGDAIDDRNWDGLDRIFTPDGVFDLTDLDIPLLVGLPEIKRFMDEDAQHPKTHTMTNIYVDETADGVKLNFRIVALQRGGLAGTASYYDDVVKTPDGWRVTHRVVTLRRRPRLA